MSQIEKLNINVMFAIALEIITILQSKPIDSDGEQLVIKMVKRMLEFRDNYQKDSETSSSNNMDK